MSTEYYMIEKIIDGKAHWWIPDHSEVTHWDDPSRWTTDSSKARHYDAKSEAEDVMGNQMPGCFVTTHIDCGGPRHPNPQAVVKALEETLLHFQAGPYTTRLNREATIAVLNEALSIARSIAEQWDGMVEAKKGLEWLLKRSRKVNDYDRDGYACPEIFRQIRFQPDTEEFCPIIIKRYLEEGK